MGTAPRILAFAGSARSGSFNKRLVAIAAAGARAAGAEVTLLDLRDYPLPLYDSDLEEREGIPSNARKLKDLFLANQGAEVIRLDAVAFIWKQLGTSCENLPGAHTLIRAFNASIGPGGARALSPTTWRSRGRTGQRCVLTISASLQGKGPSTKAPDSRRASPLP
jgi:hypothetical protein